MCNNSEVLVSMFRGQEVVASMKARHPGFLKIGIDDIDDVDGLLAYKQSQLSGGAMNKNAARDKMMSLVEDYFPKGECQERGQAIVLIAKAIIVLDDVIDGYEHALCHAQALARKD